MRLYVQAPAHFNRTTYDVVLIDGRAIPTGLHRILYS
jgi:hypothetical protein